MRPGGEKLHEALVGADESPRTVWASHTGWHGYVIEPALPISWRLGWSGIGLRGMEVRSDTARRLTVEELREMVGEA